MNFKNFLFLSLTVTSLLTLADPCEAMFGRFFGKNREPDEACLPPAVVPVQAGAASSGPAAPKRVAESAQPKDEAPASTTPEGKSIEEREIEDLHEKAAQGDVTAQLQLGLAYRKGRGVPKSKKEAINWYEHVEKGDAEALNADPEVLNFLGVCYQGGKEVTQDDKKAVRYFERASKLGCAAADFNLALCYREGRGGLRSDLGKAFSLFYSAAERGDQEVMAALESRAARGYGDVREVLDWLARHSNQGAQAGKVATD